ncbi:HYC_CC_PP family protein [Chitinophaga vietnamensis]|uniref:HYC_CC_PP family protein n=1 Tax=Chitinophaga vietnamensis TaxID=2593957 RepID=UPI001177FCAE|nr:hypothetical protein [Chitinophaga vietnamensis]
MKRFFVILFAMLYVALTSGFTVNVHYCMGKLASVELHGTPEDICKRCGKPVKGMDCCKNEFKFCKVTETHQAAKALQQDFSTDIALQLPVKILQAPVLPQPQTLIGGYHHDPPDIPHPPIFLQNCTFLI